MKTSCRAYVKSMGEGVGEDASVGDIHGTGRVSVSRHYNFLRIWTLFCYLTAQNVPFILASLNKELGWGMGRERVLNPS